MLAILCAVLLQPNTKPETLSWTVGGTKREALVYFPTKKTDADVPVVFGFHGHGGTAKSAANKFRYQEVWPEAMVVYMQGIPTVTKNDPDGKKNGWQNGPGLHEDRDLKFFDTVLETVKKKAKIDESRIFACGHSNGGGFTYCLWSERPKVFAAFAPSASGGARVLKKLTPKPVLLLAGEKDKTVPFTTVERAFEALKKLNGVHLRPEAGKDGMVQFPSAKGTPVATFFHTGGHEYAKGAPEVTVRFFKSVGKK